MRVIGYATLVTLVVVPLFLPASLSAQSKKRTDRSSTKVVIRHSGKSCCYGNRWLFEPYAGAFKDAYDVSPDDENTSALLGLRVGYLKSARARLLANVGYSRSDNVVDPQATSHFIYDNTWIFTTAGGEFDVVPGSTSASIGIQAGAAWRRLDLDGQVGLPDGQPAAAEGFSAQTVVIPAALLRHRLFSRATLTAGVHDYIFEAFEGSAQHSIALTAGLALR